MGKTRKLTQSIAAALTLLAVPCTAAAPATPKTHAVWADNNTNTLGGPSPDGRYLSFVDKRGNLAVRDLTAGENRTLTRKAPGQEGEFAYFSTFAPDSRHVAYAWFNDEHFYDLRVIALDGSEPRVLYRNPEAGFVQPVAYSPDGNNVLTLLFRNDNVSQIALISTTDGSARVLTSLSWVYPKRMDFSPDGKFIVYDATVRDDAPERDIYIIAVDGSSRTTLTDHPANDIFPLWSPDGKSVFYASDRDGTMDAWMIPVTEGKPSGDPIAIKKDLGRILPMDFTNDGRLFYGLRTGTTDVYVAGLDIGSVKLVGPAARLSSRFDGGNQGPEWSPDGRHLAYLSRFGTENYGQEYRAVTIRDTQTAEEKSLSPSLAFIDRIRWSPAGDSLLLSGSDDKGRAGLFSLDLRSGGVAPLVTERGASFRGFEGVWSRDGKSVYFVYPLGPRGGIVRSYNVEARQQQDVYRPASPARIHLLERSPVSDSLVFAEIRGEENVAETVFVLEPANADPEQLLHSQYGGLSGMEWTPDGKHILVSTEASQTSGLWKVSVAQSEPRQIEAPWKQPGPIRVSPDGKRIAFAVGETKSEVWVMEGVFSAASAENEQQ